MSGVANIARGITTINRLRASIRDLPLRLRSAVAKDAEGILNRDVHSAFDGGQTVYGTARPTSKDPKRAGAPLSLVKTGRTRGALNFVAIGTILRAQLGTKYARFLVGKYQILPQRLPAAWRLELEQLVREYAEIYRAELAR